MDYEAITRELAAALGPPWDRGRARPLPRPCSSWLRRAASLLGVAGQFLVGRPRLGADGAGPMLADARRKGELATRLQHALESRILIEQAKGVLMERYDLDDQAAFTRLRRLARASSRKLADVARDIIGDHR